MTSIILLYIWLAQCDLSHSKKDFEHLRNQLVMNSSPVEDYAFNSSAELEMNANSDDENPGKKFFNKMLRENPRKSDEQRAAREMGIDTGDNTKINNRKLKSYLKNAAKEKFDSEFEENNLLESNEIDPVSDNKNEVKKSEKKNMKNQSEIFDSDSNFLVDKKEIKQKLKEDKKQKIKEIRNSDNIEPSYGKEKNSKRIAREKVKEQLMKDVSDLIKIAFEKVE